MDDINLFTNNDSKVINILFGEVDRVLQDTKQTVKKAEKTIEEVKTETKNLDKKFETLSDEVVSTLKVIQQTGLKGEKGDPADEEGIEERLLSKIPKLEDVVSNLPTEEEIANKVLKLIPENKPSLKIIQESIDINQVAEKVKETLKVEDLKDWKDKFQNIKTEISRNKGGYHGGGFNNIAGESGTVSTGLDTLKFTGAGVGSITQTGRTVTVDIISGGGSGTVTSVTSANSDATVANTTTTPVITIVSAPKLTTGRTIAITGDLTYTSPSFDGSGNVTAAGTLATVNSNVGSFTNASITVNAKGLITAASSGTAPVTSVGATSPITSSGGATPTISTSMATGKLIGRSTAGTGVMEEITVGSGLTLSAGTLSATGGGTGTVTSVGSVDGSITVTNATTTPDLAVVKAPKWTTARNLAGNSVDGSANVAFTNKFIVQGTTDTGLSGAQFLGALATGIVKNTTTTGVLSIATAGTDYEVPLTFSTGLTRSTNTITVNTSQNISTLSNLTSNGLVTTSGGTGALSITVPGTGVLTALANNVGSAGAFVTYNGALGTPSSGTGTNITGIPAANILAGTFGTGSYTIDTRLTVPQILNTPATITVSSNAGTVTRANRINNFTNSSAATMTITMSTSGATDGDMVMVVILDATAAAQTITWVNTENSTVTAPTTSNGSTTLPLTVGFKWNSSTSKWRCIAKS